MQAKDKDEADKTKAKAKIKEMNKELAGLQRQLLEDSVKDKPKVEKEATKYCRSRALCCG